MKLITKILGILLLGISQSLSAQNISKITADSAYVSQNYKLAIEQYESLLKQGAAADIYYNLGNSYYKTQQLGLAIFNYERALKLNPSDGDIVHNLAVSTAHTVDKVNEVPQMFLVTWTKSLIYSFSLHFWAFLGVVCFVIAILSIGLYMLARTIAYRKSGFFLAIASLLICVLANLFAAHQRYYMKQHNEAIVLSPTVTVHSTPSTDGTALFILHEGCKLTIKDGSMNEWKEVQLSDGKVGWISIDDIGIY
ncbi:MAG: tetratricopeptide repeat protein [Bacteroidaceae bacterium]